jgi:hypothetical protein
MNWQERDRELQKKIEEERQCLLAMTDEEASNISPSRKYQRFRYLSEIEAAKDIAELRKAIPHINTKTHKQSFSSWRSGNGN